VAASSVVILAAGGVTAFLVTRSGSSHSSKEVYGTFGTFDVSYGSTEKQVLAKVGAPGQKRNGCWIYRIRNATLGGVKLPQEVAEMDAVRYCFAAGVVSVIEDHYPPGSNAAPTNLGGHGSDWFVPITFGCGGKRCVNTS
jgi:hypothetical protein